MATQVAVAARDLEVTIVGAMPLIDVLGDLDLPAVEMKPPELFDAVFEMGFHEDLHSVPLDAQDPRHLSVGPESPHGVFGRESCGSFRHASSVDWFIA